MKRVSKVYEQHIPNGPGKEVNEFTTTFVV